MTNIAPITHIPRLPVNADDITNHINAVLTDPVLSVLYRRYTTNKSVFYKIPVDPMTKEVEDILLYRFRSMKTGSGWNDMLITQEVTDIDYPEIGRISQTYVLLFVIRNTG